MSVRRAVSLLAAVMATHLSGIGSSALATSTLTTLYRFAEEPYPQSDGSGPVGTLIFDRSGSLYGATEYGGTVVSTGHSHFGGGIGAGTVFRLRPSGAQGNVWTHDTLYRFGGRPKSGEAPQGGVTLDQLGAIYGTTQFGGEHDLGVVFKLTLQDAVWSETVLHSFSGDSDGAHPSGDLPIDESGALYGTATSGGSRGGGSLAARIQGNGTVFKVAPSTIADGQWVYTLLYSFSGEGDGGTPGGHLVRGKDGTLFGTTSGGGLVIDGRIHGTVFALVPSPAPDTAFRYTVLYRFSGGIDGDFPCDSIVMDDQGALYGMTSDGGQHGRGTVFRRTPPTETEKVWNKTILYNFPKERGGMQVCGGLARDHAGFLYVTNPTGGSEGKGSVYRLTSSRILSATLYSFTQPVDGIRPDSIVVLNNTGVLYGTTREGGIFERPGFPYLGGGTVFKLHP
jgi:uncharacterized repeat protein (TIGR03803 family)